MPALDIEPWADPPLAAADFDVPHPAPFAVRIRPRPAEASRGIPHVNNVVYVAWLDRLAELHADALGWTRAAMVERDRAWFVARHEIDYRAEAWPGDTLVGWTWIADVRRAKAIRHAVVVRVPATDDASPPAAEAAAAAVEPVIVCRARTTWVHLRLSDRRPLRHDPELVAAFAPCGEAGMEAGVR